MTGLLLEPALDAWSDWGLLDVPDPALKQLTTEQKTFRDFIATAYPDYAFHTWANKLIGLCEQIADGTLNRLIVTIPPRTGKSLLVSKLFPAYWISRYPSRFCAIASYSAELAYAHSREARHYYVSANHQLSKDSTAVGNWLTPDRGGCIAAGVRGPFTGKGYALGIIDDPYKGPEDAGSAAQRKKLIEWFQSVWLTRAEPGITPAATPGVSHKGAGAGASGNGSAAQVVVLTRWHQDDLIGWLMEQENGDAPQHWHVLNLPAICEAQPVFPATVTVIPDWRRIGEALCPERVPLTELNQIRIRAGLYWWNALYQQRPSPADGLLFQRQWIKYTGPKGQTPANQRLKEPRPIGSGPSGPRGRGPHSRDGYAPLVLSCDLSFKGAETNDYCAFVLLGLIPETTPIHPAPLAKAQGLQLHKTAASAGPIPGPASGSHRIEVLSSVHYHLDLPGVLKHLTQTLQILSEQGLSPDAVLIEDAANGPAVCQLLRRQIPGLIAIRPVGSKSSRAHAAAPLMEAGQLAFNPGNEELINELLGFPNAANDDLVDAFCQGVIWLQNKYWRAKSRGTPLPLLFSR